LCFMPTKNRSPKNLSPEFEELRGGIIGALPAFGNEIASMFGRVLPRITARDKAGLERKLDRVLRMIAPPLQRLEELKDKPGADAERLATLEQFLASLLRASGWKLRPGEDSWGAFLRMTAKAAEPPRGRWAQLPAYHSARCALCSFLVDLY
jgi:hypothetical protein